MKFLTAILLCLSLEASGQGYICPLPIGAVISNTITPTNLVAHYDASVSSSITIATGVSQWNDLTGNGHHLKQSTGSHQPVASGSGTSSIITFNGTSQSLKTSTFTLTQPTTIYFVGEQISYNGGGYGVYDGNVIVTMFLGQYGGTTPTPTVVLNGGGNSSFYACGNNSWTVGSHMVLAAVFNGTSSTLSVNDGTKATGNAGTSSGNGFTVGSDGSQSFFTNIAVKEIAIYSAAHGSSTQTTIINLLRTKWGI